MPKKSPAIHYLYTSGKYLYQWCMEFPIRIGVRNTVILTWKVPTRKKFLPFAHSTAIRKNPTPLQYLNPRA